ncbi:MAG: 2-oxo acid dehydrogenase subunit E2 [Anaerolineae bacterium]|nr:2-oxo acid dehydrogenase subunit E2 [Anaerolineae bacterium]
MATPIPLPKLGNTVESVIVLRWLKQVGDPVRAGESLIEVETDKAAMEVESPTEGVLLAQLCKEGDEVPVMVNIAVVGAAGEDVSAFAGTPAAAAPAPVETSVPEPAPAASATVPAPAARTNGAPAGATFISPRARNLAERKGLDPVGIAGSGPEGRIIERDVQAALQTQPKLTPLAKSMVEKGGFVPPEGATGRVTTKDLTPPAAALTPSPSPIGAGGTDSVEIIPLKGARKVIAARMLESLQTTAQLTLNASADARALQAFRKRLKASPAEMGLQGVTINDLVLFAVARTLPRFSDLNALFTGDAVHRYGAVHLGVAVDTPRGLLVPVVRNADGRSLKGLAEETHRLAEAAQAGKILPDEMNGGTFSVTNLGAFGIESFTPVLNPPQVAILGVSNIQLKPIEVDEKPQLIPHIGLSLTINHQVVDGAPGARFLQALAKAIASIDLLVAG